MTIYKTEILQPLLPNSKVVKAFNMILQEVFEYSIKDLKLYNIACFITSAFLDAKSEISLLSNDLGFTSQCRLVNKKQIKWCIQSLSKDNHFFVFDLSPVFDRLRQTKT